MHDLLLSPLQLRHATVTAARSGAAMTPPLKPPTGVSIPRRSISMRKPRGGRLLMIEKRIPLARSSATAEHLNGSGRASLMTIVHHHRRRRSASAGHFAPKAHPLRTVLSSLPDRSANLLRRRPPRHRAPAAQCAKPALPYRRA